MTLQDRVHAVRHQPDGMNLLVEAIKGDAVLQSEARRKLVEFRDMEIAGRMDACWISRFTRDTLTAALAASTI